MSKIEEIRYNPIQMHEAVKFLLENASGDGDTYEDIKYNIHETIAACISSRCDVISLMGYCVRMTYSGSLAIVDIFVDPAVGYPYTSYEDVSFDMDSTINGENYNVEEENGV